MQNFVVRLAGVCFVLTLGVAFLAGCGDDKQERKRDGQPLVGMSLKNNSQQPASSTVKGFKDQAEGDTHSVNEVPPGADASSNLEGSKEANRVKVTASAGPMQFEGQGMWQGMKVKTVEVTVTDQGGNARVNFYAGEPQDIPLQPK